uniref:Golgi-associated, gamma adaptin ear containing, ARF binding protein 1 n=1 Tax=Myripristis murdjan TaxID=586833 RepID=A0A667ZVK6_9TELE
HKLQSPQEWEAMQALMVLETCMKNCGKRFHSEVGKFRFLNELIKVVSPKYLGSRAPEPVKKKVLEMMYSWTVRLPDETKIADAYQMLKKQGIVKQDPVLPDDNVLPPPPPRAKSAIFEDEEKSKTLSRLLNSTHPEDLRAANKLIKEMVQEDQKRTEQVSKRVNAIQEVNESVGLLSQLLEGYSKGSCSQSNQELIKDLYQRCEKMRPTLFRLASDTEDNDEALGKIVDVMALIELMYHLMQNNHNRYGATQLVTLQTNCLAHSKGKASGEFQPQSRPTLRDLQTKSSTSAAVPSAAATTAPSVSLALRSEQPGPQLHSSPSLSAPTKGSSPASDSHNNISLADVTVPLESIKPSSLLPVTVFDKHSLRVLFHFARDCPPSRPDVLVVIISMLSSAPVPVTNIRFQSAVPKVMKVKLQPPSGTELPAFNPILPPAAITQILLLANPHKEKVRLRYKLTFNLGDKFYDESGDVDQFPPPNTWGNL